MCAARVGLDRSKVHVKARTTVRAHAGKGAWGKTKSKDRDRQLDRDTGC